MKLESPTGKPKTRNNFANWNILVAKGKKIKRDIVSSDERKLKSQKPLNNQKNQRRWKSKNWEIRRLLEYNE